ncbi:hypothetical protein V6N13_001485 [Hibiscus sabdariffa]
MHSCLICPPSPIYYYCCICVKSGFRIQKIFQKLFQHKRRCGDDEQQDHAEDIRGTAPTQEQEDVGMMSNRIMQL